MPNKKIKLPLAVSSWGQEEIQALEQVIRSNNFTMGKNVEIFEKEFADYHGSKFCIMVNSGSSANHLAISSLFFRKDGRSLKPGDEVIVPAVSWSTTYSPLFYHGLKLRFVDIDIDTLNIDVSKLSDAVTPETKAILAVNLLGNPNYFDQLNKIVDVHDLLLLEDNCESLGAVFNNQKSGTFGLLGTCSGFFSHHISTMEGGMILTDDEEIYHILLSLRAHGWTRNLPKNNKLIKKSSNEFNESFRFILPGYNVRPLEFSGAIGQVQLRKLKKFISRRRANADRFVELFSRYSFLKIQKEVGKSSWFGFSFILDESHETKRDDFINFLNQNGVECRPIVAGNIIHNPMIKFYDYSIYSDLSNADLAHYNGFFIGNHHFRIEDLLVDLDNKIQNKFGS